MQSRRPSLTVAVVVVVAAAATKINCIRRAWKMIPMVQHLKFLRHFEKRRFWGYSWCRKDNMKMRSRVRRWLLFRWGLCLDVENKENVFLLSLCQAWNVRLTWQPLWKDIELSWFLHMSDSFGYTGNTSIYYDWDLHFKCITFSSYPLPLFICTCLF